MGVMRRVAFSALAMAAALAGFVAQASAQTVLRVANWLPPKHPADRRDHHALDRAGEGGHQGPRRHAGAAVAARAATRPLRLRRERHRRCHLRRAQLHAGPVRGDDAGRAALLVRQVGDPLGRLLARAPEAPRQGQRAQGHQAARRVHARAGAAVDQGPQPQGHGLHQGLQDPHRRRLRPGGGQGAAAGADPGARHPGLRDPLRRCRRRHPVPRRVRSPPSRSIRCSTRA